MIIQQRVHGCSRDLLSAPRDAACAPKETPRETSSATTPTTVGQIYSSYVIPLAAIGPVASFIGWTVFGLRVSFVGTVYRVPVGTAIGRAVLSYVLSLIVIYICALIIDGLAPTFGGTQNRVQAFKVTAYSWTAAWLAGIFSLIPAVGILAILGLYSLYLLYTGLPVLMKSPPDRAMGYTVVAILAAIVLYIVVGAIVGAVFALGVGSAGVGYPH